MSQKTASHVSQPEGNHLIHKIPSQEKHQFLFPFYIPLLPVFSPFQFLHIEFKVKTKTLVEMVSKFQPLKKKKSMTCQKKCMG